MGPNPASDLARLSISSSSRASDGPSTASTTSSSSTPTFAFRIRYTSDMDMDVPPKLEELDDDDQGDVKNIPLAEVMPTHPNAPQAKRPRGRPRKNPPASQTSSLSKVTKGRSKTGCITCRRRKKKCDETKPHCLNCQKNNVACEGYTPKETWKSGKQKVAEARRSSARPHSLPCLIDGIETELDRYFLDHFVNIVSKVLTLINDESNPFKEILLPMAIKHRGLMHSLLCLSGSHLAARESKPDFNERQMYHFDRAVCNLRTDKKIEAQASGDSNELIDDPTVAQTLVLLLTTICKGNTDGEYRPHMDATRHLIVNQESQNQPFGQFLIEFYLYHDVSNSLTSLDRRPLLLMENFQLPTYMMQPEAGAMLGVLDGLFGYISKITQLRDNIRTRRSQGLSPLVDYEMLNDAVIIDNEIRNWSAAQREGTPRYIAAQLYRQCTWVYLYRTVQPSMPHPKIHEAVDVGLDYLRELPADSSTQSVLLMPLFLLGCAAFDPAQRPDIRQAFEDLQVYSNLGNIKPARKIVELVWEKMDAEDESSWDWETIIKEAGYDFLVT